MFVTFLYLAGLCSPLIDARSLRGTMNPHAGTPGAALRSPPAIDAFPSGEQNVFGTNVHRPPTPGAALRLPPAIDASPSGEQTVLGTTSIGLQHRGLRCAYPRLLTCAPPGHNQSACWNSRGHDKRRPRM